ncbi:MAG TPA: pitrilysin family protein [Gemmatimonadaceae bacterium]|nr:pitrilysin family protein [Gemmatimonadaceae bacterium]
MSAPTIAPASPALIDADTVRCTVLPNGLTVLVRRDRSAPVVAIVTYVSAGYFDETDDVVGIAHVLEHMFFKGTPTRGVGEIARQTKAVGGYLNAATIYDHTSYYTVLPASSFAAGLDVQFDAYANSLIDAEELARELEVIIQEAKRKADNPPAVATETLYELLHDQHRIRRWRIGREPGLRALTREAMLRFYRNFYHPANTVLSIVGDVDVNDVMREVTQRYGALPSGAPVRTPGPAEDGPGGFRYQEWSGDIGQTQLAFGWRTPGTLDDDTPGLDILATVLAGGRASRLYRAVREKQLASSISAYDYTPTTLGVFVVHAETPPECAAEAARVVWSQLRALRDEGVSEGELVRAKRLYESRWIRRLEDMEGQANYLAEWQALGDWQRGDAYLRAALAVTTEDLQRLAQRYLDPEQAGLVLYRPEGTPPVAADTDAMREMLEAAPAADVERIAASTPEAPAIHGGPRAEREDAGVRVYRSPSGVPILVRRKPGALAHAGVYVQGGARDEPLERAGLTSLMVRTAVKGTERRTAAQIAEEAELLGGSIGGATGSESFGWSISVPSRQVAPAIALLADVVQHASIPDDAFETERAVSLADLVALRDDMYRFPMRLATTAAFAGHPYGVPATGDEVTLPRLTVDEARAWHRERVLGGPAVIAIVGDAEPDDLAALAAARFGELTGGELVPLESPAWPASVVQRVEQREKAQTALALLFPGPSRRDPARFAAAMIAGVASGLGGRFFDELRDKQSLGYTVHAFANERALAGTFGAYIATSPEKEEVARRGLLGEFAKLRNELVTTRELQQAQTYAIGVHAIRQQSGGAVLSDIVDAWMFGELAELREFDQRVRAVTAEQMLRVAREYFDEGRRVEGIVRGVGRTV